MLVAFETLPPPVMSDRESQKTSWPPLTGYAALPLISVGTVSGSPGSTAIATLESFNTTRPL
jgi:hypothetical protein